jgi:hypothetical protein
MDFEYKLTIPDDDHEHNQPFVAAAADYLKSWQIFPDDYGIKIEMLDAPFTILNVRQFHARFNPQQTREDPHGPTWFDYHVHTGQQDEYGNIIDDIDTYGGFWRDEDQRTPEPWNPDDGPLTVWGWSTDSEGTVALFVTVNATAHEPQSLVLFW